ncbi:MAG: aminotransferase class IV [Phycisphaerales bacterium]
MPTIFLNGRFVEGDDARLSVFDAGIQHGVGLFETLLGGVSNHQPWAMALDAHLDRLTASARELGLSDRFRADALAKAVLATIARAGLPLARLRLTITGGDLNLLARPQTPPANSAAPNSEPPIAPPLDPTILIVAQPPTVYPDAFFDRGISCVVGEWRLNPLDPLAGHKTVNYWARLRELQRAAAAQAGEALILSLSNHLTGGCVSNAFVVRDGTLITPLARGEEPDAAPGAVLRSPVLPGVTRAWVRDHAASLGVPVQARMVSIDDLLQAHELFLTNSSWGVLPVVRVERHQVADGTPGPLTRRFIDAWRTALDTAAS